MTKKVSGLKEAHLMAEDGYIDHGWLLSKTDHKLTWFECKRCGVVVFNREQHDLFHMRPPKPLVDPDDGDAY